MHRHISHAKATRELGYQPRPFEQTVRDTLAWFAEAGMLKEPFTVPEASAVPMPSED
jgi:hypothetical protein